ncbi:sn-glycerol-3-phosphate ABC transporter ATP-binding protein UgpC [soil metagenome]
MARARFEHVTRTFGDTIALDDLTLDVEEGEFLVLVGPSGCGKTTALRGRAGLDEPDSGAVYIGDRDVTYVEPADRDVAMVFQNYALYPYLSVFDNIAFPLKMRKTPKQERRERVEAVADMLDILPLLDRKPQELSGDQRQRVALGRAIVRDPAVFLMDEPLSNLDAQLRGQTRTELVRLQRELGTTTIYVTHDQTEAMTMGHRLAVMHQGRLQQLATPMEIYSCPANLFVAGFIGNPPMNQISAVVDRERRRLVTNVGWLSLAREVEDRIADRETVILGIRPEHARTASPTATARTSEIEGLGLNVDVIEALGSDTYVTAASGLRARLPDGLETSGGERLLLTCRTDQLHMFDANSGARL